MPATSVSLTNRLAPTGAVPLQKKIWTPRLFWIWVPQLLGSALWWYIIDRVLAGHISFVSDRLSLVLGVAAMGTIGLGWWIGTALFGSALMPTRRVRLLTAGIGTLPIWIFLPFEIWTGAAWLMSFAGLTIGMEQAYEHAHNSLLVRTRQVIGSSLGFPLLCVMVATSILYFQQLRLSTASPDQLATNFVNQSATTVERLLPKLRSDYRIGMTVDEMLGLFIPNASDVLADVSTDGRLDQTEQEELRRQLAERGVPVEDLQLDFSQTEAQLQIALDEQIALFRGEIISNLRQELSRTLQLELRGDDAVHASLQAYFGRQFDRYVREYLTWLPPLLALALFFVLRLVSIFFQWAILFIGWFWSRILRWTHVVGIVHETVPAERLNWNT